MLKTFIATVALATSAFVLGFHSDLVGNVAGKMYTQAKGELTAAVQQGTLDPERAFRECFALHAPRVNACQPYADAWIARDGADAGWKIIGLANRPN